MQSQGSSRGDRVAEMADLAQGTMLCSPCHDAGELY